MKTIFGLTAKEASILTVLFFLVVIVVVLLFILDSGNIYANELVAQFQKTQTHQPVEMITPTSTKQLPTKTKIKLPELEPTMTSTIEPTQIRSQ